MGQIDADTRRRIEQKFALKVYRTQLLRDTSVIPKNQTLRDFAESITASFGHLEDEYPIKSYGRFRSASQASWISLVLSEQNEYILLADRDIEWFLSEVADLSMRELTSRLNYYASLTSHSINEKSPLLSFLFLSLVIYAIGTLEVKTLLESGHLALGDPTIISNLNYLHCLEDVQKRFEKLSTDQNAEDVEILKGEVNDIKKALNDLFAKLNDVESNRHF